MLIEFLLAINYGKRKKSKLKCNMYVSWRFLVVVVHFSGGVVFCVLGGVPVRRVWRFQFLVVVASRGLFRSLLGCWLRDLVGRFRRVMVVRWMTTPLILWCLLGLGWGDS
jgi:hypothetical protein